MKILKDRSLERFGPRCIHCGHEKGTLPIDTLSVEHLPFTRGRRKDLEFDVRNTKYLSCTMHQASNAKGRKDPYSFLPLSE